MRQPFEQTTDPSRKRRRLRIIIPAYPAFNIYSQAARQTTALGPVCVATAVNDIPGWDAEVIDENNYRRGAPTNHLGRPDHRALQELRPADVIGLYGGLTSTIPRLFEIAAAYQHLAVPVIAGGQHFVGDNIEDALHQGVDFLVIGEGERTIGELLECLEGKKDKRDIRGIAYLENGQPVQTPERELLTDFDQLPLPDFSLVRYARLAVYPVGRVRGCGMNCEFCTVKGKPRYASAQRLMAQFASLFEKRKARRFFIVDDLFGQDRRETIHLCRMLRDYQRRTGVRFHITVQIRLDKARDAELLEAMREAGIAILAVGFESPIAEELEAMNKRLDPEEMIALTRTYRRAGFRVHGMFIFGYPVQEGVDFRMGAPERVRRFRKFIKKAHLHTIQVLLPAPLPGTELTRRLREQDRIYSTQHVSWKYYDGNFPLFQPDEPLTPEDMQAAIRKIMGRFYGPRHLFSIGLHTLSFPVLVFFFHNLDAAWRRWTRKWWRNVMGFGGWRIVRKWNADFKKGTFSAKLEAAKKALPSINSGPELVEGPSHQTAPQAEVG